MGILTFEVIQKNLTSREVQELEDCGHAVHRNCAACVKDRCARKHLQVEPLEKEGRERTKSSWVSFDCIFLTQENADTILECESEPSPEVFQDTKIHSCVLAVVRITDDIPLLNWIPRFAMRFLNKMRTGRRWKKSVVQFGEEELTSLVKRIIQGVFVRHLDRTRTISHITKSGIVQGGRWTRQILSDAWVSVNWEKMFATRCIR